MKKLLDNLEYRHINIINLSISVVLIVLFAIFTTIFSGYILLLWIIFFTFIGFGISTYLITHILRFKSTKKENSMVNEKQLLSKYKYSTALLNNTPNIILLLRNGYIVDSNRTFKKIFKKDSNLDNIMFCDIIENDINYFNCNSSNNFGDEILDTNQKVKVKIDNEIKFFYIKAKLIDKEQNEYLAILSDITKLETQVKNFKYIATTDALTKICNRFQFEILFDQEIKNSIRHKLDLSLIFLDIDHFKNINDTYGHDIGDKALIHIANIIKKNIRISDIFARWGGEEFVILLPATDSYTSMKIADKLRKKIENENFESINSLTCSLGVTEFTETDTKESFIKRADEALYAAKRDGRNRVELEI